MITCSPNFRAGLIAACALFAVLSWSPRASADVLLLNTGGRLQGEWLNREEAEAKTYRFRVASGIELEFARTAVKKVILQTPAQAEYEKALAAAGDTADAHWQLAELCRAAKLLKERQYHLERVLELDTDHEQARYALGHSRQRVNGKKVWTSPDDYREREGQELYRGKWRLAQEIELLEAKRKREEAERDWLSKLKTYREQLSRDPQQAAKAREAILAIRDPQAARALLTMLYRETLRAVALLYVETLGNIKGLEALEALAITSLDAHDEEVRTAALDRVVLAKGTPGLADYYVKRLRSPNNYHLNRAAAALARLEDKSVIRPLIDALVTTHHYVFRSGNADAITTTFEVAPSGKQSGKNSSGKGQGSSPTSSGSGGVATGGRTQVVSQTIANQEVLNALVALSDGANFSYDKTAWQRWYASRVQVEGERTEGELRK